MQPSLDSGGFMPRWSAAAARLLVPGVVLATAWALFNVPFSLHDGARGFKLAFQASFGPLITSSLLVASIALVDAARLRGRARTSSLVTAAMAAAALALVAGILVMTWTGAWPAPLWSSPVLMWANFGSAAMICVGAVIVEDERVRSRLRAAALRDARLRAADVVRRTAEVRLQAARARVEPRFLFDALSAVERVYDADAQAGNELLDNVVTYLRAVVPDLHETQPNDEREAEIARLRLAIEHAILGGTRADAAGGRA
jgi:hypothetical protein